MKLKENKSVLLNDNETMSTGEIILKHKHGKKMNAKRNKILYMVIEPTPLKIMKPPSLH